MDRRLSFSEHLQIATAKAIQCGANSTWLMLNICGTQGSEKETAGERGALEAALCSSGLVKWKAQTRRGMAHEIAQ